MLKRNLISAWRSLSIHRKQMMLGLLGLIIGLSSFLLIVHYSIYEFSYDKFNENGKNVFRIDQKKYVNGSLTDHEATCGLKVAETLKSDFQEIEEVVRIHKCYGSTTIRYNEKSFYEIEKCCYTEPSFFKIFTFPIVKGDPNDLLKPNSVFISEFASKKYFGDKDPVGENIVLNDFIGEANYYICGVYKNMPSNSHFQYDFLFSNKRALKHFYYIGKNAWLWNNFYTYIQLKPKTNVQVLQGKVVDLAKNHIQELLEKANTRIDYVLKPLFDIHLNSNLNELKTNGNSTEVYLLLLVGIMVLFISWSNYINSFTVRILDRARELSVKRVVGAFNWDFAKQFFTEAFLINLITVIFTLVVILFSYIEFNNIIGTYNISSIWNIPIFWMILLIVITIGTIIFGIYPVLLISSFDTTLLLKGKGSRAKSNDFLRKSLVVFQFVCSVILIISSFSINSQISFMKNTDLGINIKQKLVIPVPGESVFGQRINSVLPAFVKELKNYSEINNVSHTYNLPGSDYANRGFVRKESDPESNNRIINYVWVDREYINMFNIGLLEGENFPEVLGTPNTRALITKSGAKLLGYNKIEDIINEKLTWLGGVVEIYGVIDDYHHLSLKSEMQPILLFEQNLYMSSFICVEFREKNLKETVPFVKTKFAEYFPNTPFDYSFLDQSFNSLYLPEIRFGKIINLLTIIILFISCVGLVSITSHVMVRKHKEIAIRKVFGASSIKLYYLLVKEILFTVLISVLIAFPLAYIWFSNWLDNFASKVKISIWLFIIPILIVLILVLLIVTFDTIKVVRRNPAEVLKEE